MIPPQIYEVGRWSVIHIGPPAVTFYLGLLGGLSQHVQKPLAEYRQTLADISQLMLRTVPVLYEQREKTGVRFSADERKLYDDLRVLHGRLISSSDSIPRFARPVLRLLGLLRSQKRIKEGAKMLIGISNEMLAPHKSLSHVRVLSEKLQKELGITV